MLNRRHIRAKSDAVYLCDASNRFRQLEKEEKFLLYSVENMLDLYLLMLSAVIEIRQKEQEYQEKARTKHLATAEKINQNSSTTLSSICWPRINRFASY
ncbi:MAG: hypothetical protein U0X58_00715 [Flavobacteriaceae bacterium]